MHAEMLDCLNCKDTLEVRMLGLWSGLGPPSVRCAKCGTVANLGRKEWSSFRRKDLFRFFAVSAIAVAGIALLGGAVGGMSYPVPGVPWGERVIDANPGYYIGATLFALLGCALQVYRVVASKRRAAASRSEPFPQSWTELQTNVQLKALFLVLALGVIGGGLSYALSP